MAKPKKAASHGSPGPGKAERPADPAQAGGSDDAAAGAQLAVRLLVRDLRALETGPAKRKPEDPAPLSPETGNLVALYARTLSAIERDRRKGGRGELGDLSNEELMEKALQIPELRDLLKAGT